MLAMMLMLLMPAGAVRRSEGCGLQEPFSPSDSPQLFSLPVADSTQDSGSAERWYWVTLPKVYNKNTPAMVVFNFHGFYDRARDEIFEDEIPTFIDKSKRNAVTVYPVGSGDVGDGHQSWERFGWNVDGNGLNTGSGPMGPVCLTPRYPEDAYTCYTSCSKSKAGCNKHMGCNCASCMEDSTFVKALVDRVSKDMCIDLDHIHLTGISNGAMMVYQVALDIPEKIASIAPVAGSRLLGYNWQPASPVALLDIHGYADIYVPANMSQNKDHLVPFGPGGSLVSEDQFYYTPLANITAAYAAANGCNGGNLAYPTKWDGALSFSCNQPHGSCGHSSIVQCVGDWGHTWPLHHVAPDAYAELMLEFFDKHPLWLGPAQR